jgi:hypothetical protein
MERAITVATSRVPDLQKAVASLRRTTKRLGLDPSPSLAVNWNSKREVKQTRETVIMDGATVEDVDAHIVVVPIVDCVITLPESGARPPGDWRVAGVIERIAHEGEAPAELTNEIFCSPADLKKFEGFRHAALECEHCKAKRARARTLIVQEVASGRLVQVGKECATAFVGDRYERDVEILQFAEFITKVLHPFDEEQEGGFRGCGGPLTAWDAEDVMSHSCACVRTRGWQPSTILVNDRYGRQEKVPNPEATAGYVKAMITGAYLTGKDLASARTKLTQDRIDAEANLAGIKNVPEATPVMVEIFEDKLARARLAETAGLKNPPYEITEADQAEARAMIEWLAAQNPDPEKDNYLASLKAAFDPGWISEKRLSFAVSLVRAREVGRARAEFEAERAKSAFVGQPGERREFTVTVKARIPYESDFGRGVIYILRDDAGNTLKWMTSGSGLPDGTTFKIKGTVKKHAEYKGEKQTELARVKVIEPPVILTPPTVASPESGPVEMADSPSIPADPRLVAVEKTLASDLQSPAPAL